MTDHSTGVASTILVVDDDLSLLRGLERLLRVSGFVVRTFDRPSALLGTEIPTSNACLLLDIHLPEITGLELFRKLRISGCCLPVVFITGRVNTHASEIAAVPDAPPVLCKPLDTDLLLATIRQALKSHHPTTI